MALQSALAALCSISKVNSLQKWILNVLKLPFVGLPCEGCLAIVEYFLLSKWSDSVMQMQQLLT